MTRMHARDAHGRWLAALDAIEAAYRAAGLERAARFWGARGRRPPPRPPPRPGRLAAAGPALFGALAASDLGPVLRTNPGDHREARPALGAHHGHLAFGEVRWPGHGVERGAVAGGDEVLAFLHRRRKQFPELVVAPRVLRLRRPAAHLVHRLRPAEREARGFHGAAERAREHLAERDAEALHVRADVARLGAALVGEIALLRAVLIARHRRIVLVEVRRRVAHVEHQAAFSQFPDDGRIDLCCGAAREPEQAPKDVQGTSLAA